ncbi:hypothetical protein [Paraburkholderia nodosa]|uniref:hypothetical protein n=1 Tax=Paraburkholderia nodosa TaxID=392320 RepID=UPI00048809F8|nr:hypothetical protein [Paraburkholderia nodosa]
MQYTRGFSRTLFRDPAAATVEGREPVMNDVSPPMAPSSPYKFLFSCNRDGEPDRTRRHESANDFFGTEDLLSQAYEDAVHVGVVAD